MTRSVARESSGKVDEPAEQEEEAVDVVNSVLDADPKSFREAMRSERKEEWLKVISEELSAIEANGVWKIILKPKRREDTA